MNILFVCTGNTCRSPMAEALFLKRTGDKHRAFSRGISVFASQGASPHGVTVMGEYEINISNHLSKQISEDDLEKANLVLTMTKNHKEFILSAFPKFRDKVFTLSEYAGDLGDVIDPFGGGLEVYRECAAILYKLTGKIKL